MGARGSFTSLTFLLVTEGAGLSLVSAEVGVSPGDLERSAAGGVGEVWAGREEPPIRSLTSLFTSSLSLDSGSGDLLGACPRVSS